MAELTKICALGVLCVVLIQLVKKHRAEFALLLSLCAIALLGICLLGLLKPLLTFLTKLQALAGVNSALMEAMLKVIGIGILTQLASTVCADAGENAVAKTVELCGGALAVCVALPLMEAVLELLQTMGGG